MTEPVTASSASTQPASTQRREFRLPDVGEGLTEADIVVWRVKPGDTVTVNQIIVDIETAKAVVELPSPYAGVVAALLVPEGQTVDVGTPIIAVDVPGPAGAGDGAPAPGRPAGSSQAPPEAGRRGGSGGHRGRGTASILRGPGAARSPARGAAGCPGRLRRQGGRHHPAPAQGTLPGSRSLLPRAFPGPGRGTGG